MISALYIHIPFCLAKCSYCSFNSHAGLNKLMPRYVAALCQEIERAGRRTEQISLQTVFLGGGTPTILPPGLLQKILHSCFSHFSIADDAEISMEANPGTLAAESLKILRKAGVNRLSFGVQSFVDEELKQIGRIHSSAEAVLALQLARDARFDNVNMDLMYGLPGQDGKSWQLSVETALSLGVEHLSLYQLTLEEGTPLAEQVDRGLLQLPSEEQVEEMDRMTESLLPAAGFSRYEISNYARSGYQCCHNIIYWQNRDYLGVGAGAVSGVQGQRTRNVDDPKTYCLRVEKNETPVIWEEHLDREASFRETVIMGLRMSSGLSINSLQERYGYSLEHYYGEVLDRLQKDGLLVSKDGRVSLTARGRNFANRVMAELV